MTGNADPQQNITWRNGYHFEDVCQGHWSLLVSFSYGGSSLSARTHVWRERVGLGSVWMFTRHLSEPLHFVLLTFSLSASFYVLHISTSSSCSPSSVFRAKVLRWNEYGVFFIFIVLYLLKQQFVVPLSLRCSYGRTFLNVQLSLRGVSVVQLFTSLKAVRRVWCVLSDWEASVWPAGRPYLSDFKLHIHFGLFNVGLWSCLQVWEKLICFLACFISAYASISLICPSLRHPVRLPAYAGLRMKVWCILVLVYRSFHPVRTVLGCGACWGYVFKRVDSSVESQTLIQSRWSSACPSAGSPVYRCLEDTSKQVIIMRWALQKFTLVSSLSVTISSASKYSRESTSKACCSSTDDGTDRAKCHTACFNAE